MEAKEISKAVIKRLPRYYRYLGELMEENVERISSNDLSKKMLRSVRDVNTGNSILMMYMISSKREARLLKQKLHRHFTMYVLLCRSTTLMITA